MSNSLIINTLNSDMKLYKEISRNLIIWIVRKCLEIVYITFHKLNNIEKDDRFNDHKVLWKKLTSVKKHQFILIEFINHFIWILHKEKKNTPIFSIEKEKLYKNHFKKVLQNQKIAFDENYEINMTIILI
jgi:hypothetical protein